MSSNDMYKENNKYINILIFSLHTCSVSSLRQAGILQHLFNEALGNALHCLQPATAATTSVQLRPLELQDLFGILFLYAAGQDLLKGTGLTLAFVLFAFSFSIFPAFYIGFCIFFFLSHFFSVHFLIWFTLSLLSSVSI